MKLQTNYDQMTNEQLFIELYHRVSTFGDNLSTYTSGGEKITYEDQELWLGDLDTNNQSFTLLDNPLEEETENYHKITKEHKDYKNILLQLLQTTLNTFPYDAWPGNPENQQEELMIRTCIVCCDLIEEGKEYIKDHMLTRYDEDENWEDESKFYQQRKIK